MSEEHSAEKDLPALTRDYCPKCGARDRDDECATPTGRDHAARRDFTWGWDSALRAVSEARVIPPAKPSAPDLDDPIDEYRQALGRSNEARGIVR